MTAPLPLRGAPGPAAFGRKKARAFPMGKPGHFETRILRLLSRSPAAAWLRHSRRSAESQAPFRLLHHHSKMGILPLKCLRRPLRLSAGRDRRQRTTFRISRFLAGVSTTTYAMLLPGSSQAGGPAPVFTESAQTIKNSSFISQYMVYVNKLFPYLVFCVVLERWTHVALCLRRSSLTYSALKQNHSASPKTACPGESVPPGGQRLREGLLYLSARKLFR